MTTFALPEKASIVAVTQALASQFRSQALDDAIVIELPARTFIDCGALAFLGAWGQWHCAQGRRVLNRESADVVTQRPGERTA